MAAQATAQRAELARAMHGCAAALYRFIAVRVVDPHLAEDLLQQLWLQTLRRGETVRPDELEFWLRTVARNLIRAHWRRVRRRPDEAPVANAALAASLAERLADGVLPGDDLGRREVHDQLMLAITELSESEQQLIVGHYFDGQELAELAAPLGLTVRGVEGRLYRARASLRERLRHLRD